VADAGVTDGRSWVRVDSVVELFPDAPDVDRSVEFCWPDDTPNRRMVRNVTRPTLTPYLPAPERATGLGVVVCPGGWNHFLAVRHEGEDVAAALAQRGVAAFVLCYRVEPTAADHVAFEAELAALAAEPGRMDEITGRRAPLAVADGSAALDLVRARGREWAVEPARVGILGFSAGGFVATRTALEAEPGSRPAFVGALYGAPWGGPRPTPGAPPLFTAWARDDELGATVTEACPANAAAWRVVGASAEAHELADGGHGFGIEQHGTAADAWFELFLTWLGGLGAGGGAAG